MNVPCKHARSCETTWGVRCAISAFGEGKIVSFGTCLKVCTQYDGPDRAPLLAQLTAKQKPHGCCGETNIVVWAWVRWHGLPYPIRLWRWVWWASRPSPRVWPECGCLVKLAALVKAVKVAYTSVKRA